ncbi:MAG: hypothetical protein PHF46_01670 [Candidatus Gracilibacteria bacterium]|nr:hypothetical protein [Candidatus Gracilibacteria bacterium]MDD4530431.1 hypothetical protein [Candidatus Gracilibacteria bacterium]
MSNKKIKILGDSMIIDVLKKIENESIGHENVFLDIDESLVLRNYLNLKLLVYKFPRKKFSIISSDKDIKKMCESLGINYFYKSEVEDTGEEITNVNILKHNFTFFEYLIYEVKRVHFMISSFFIKRNLIYKKNHLKEKSNLFLLFTGLIMSVTLLVVIFYFAIPKTYVYITPELTIKPVMRNLIYSENKDESINNKSYVDVKKISNETNLNYFFNVSTIDESSTKKSNGVIIIVNELSQEQSFKPKTRFVTKDGLVYRADNWVKIPANSSIDIKVIADIYDTNGKIIGAKGNIKTGTLMIIPGLKFNKDKVYAKAKTDFLGGADLKNHVLTKTEFEKFKGVFIEKLKAKALDDLKNKIQAENTKNNSNYQILPVNEIIKYDVGEVTLTGGIKVGDIRDDVTLEGKTVITTYMYNKNDTIFYLKTVLNETILSGTEKLIGLNEDSVKVTNILNKTENPFYMKATTEMDSTISYDFENSSNNLTKKLKNLIVSTTPEEAKSILLNSQNVSQVSIDFSPFWLNKVASNPDNIEFVIKK